MSDAYRTGAGYFGTEHLLMGLLREGNNMAIRVLRTVGIDPKKLYSAVVKKINAAPRAAAAALRCTLTLKKLLVAPSAYMRAALLALCACSWYHNNIMGLYAIGPFGGLTRWKRNGCAWPGFGWR